MSSVVKKKNIGFLMGRLAERGGISRVTSIVTQSLVNTELYEIHIFSFHPSNRDGYEWSNEIIYHDLLSDRLSMKKGIIKASFRLRSLLRQNDISILVSCGHLVGPLGVISSLFKKSKLVYWSHSSFKGEKHFFKMFNEKFTSFFSDTVITLTKSGKKDYENNTLAKKVVQIYNPIDNKLTSRKLSYSADSKKILSVGRITDSKNFESLLLEVASIVLVNHKDYTWHIFGSGELEEVLKQRIIEMKLTDRVIFEGHTSNIYDVYQQHSILVMTSSFEGFPMSLLEGMANELPLVSFDVPTGPSEIIHNSINGFLIKPFDTEEMANKISFLIDSRKTRVNFSRNNQNFIQEFKLSNILEQWKNVLN
ncbi:glycosyltransferase [uncultured Maribacter sp.]|uniref:glycosyltransferase n=1 Tax=uncultured Maribacter sp. TaxID=431308 RepID=UPI00260FA533|nr:glycosyltransferase [uncultured Maribacter sp.]